MTESNARNCESIEPLLSAFVLEELREPERSEVSMHIATCEICSGEASLLAAAASLVAKNAPAESRLGSGERGRVIAAARMPRRAPQRYLRWIVGLAAAACVVAGLAAIWLGQGPRAKMVGGEIAMAPAALEGKLGANPSSPSTPPSTLAIESVAEHTAGAAPSGTFAGLGAEADRSKLPEVRAQLAETLETLLALAPLTPKPSDADIQKLPLPAGVVVDSSVHAPTDVAAESTKKLRTLELVTGIDTVGVGRRLSPESELLAKRGAVAAKPQVAVPNLVMAAGGAAPLRKGAVETALSDSADAPTRSYLKGEARSGGGSLELAQAEAKPDTRARFGEQGSPVAPAEAPVPLSGNTSLPGIAEASPAKSAAPASGGLAPGGPNDRYAAKSERGAPAQEQPVAALTTAPAPNFKARVDDFLTRLDRKPGETPDMMLFRYWGDNPFVEASSDALSTFAVDVDTASYTILRSYLYKAGVLPPREAIRTEELINYFSGHYAPPAADGPAFAIHTEVAAAPFAHEPEYRLLRVGIKGREVSREKRKACSLVFVIDTSGSMRRENRLELVKDALKLLTKELDEGDSIGIVAFDREARTILEPTPASEHERILDAIGRLEPRQNTNVAAGLDMGYKMAGARILKDGSNRVILLSDGVANTGILDVNTMLEQVRGQRERGVYLTTVGVGMGNLNDALLEQLADRGNGQCVYVDRIEAAHKAFVENLTGTLETIARDVKIQVEFHPARVLRYRLLGYENRAIADSAFRDNTVDAGEVGAGHEVTALYELKLRPEAAGAPPADGKFATVRVRYLTADHGEAQEIEKPVESSAAKTTFGEASPRFRMHACVGELAEVLRDSYWARGGTLDRVASLLGEILDLRESEGGPRIGEDQDIVELVALVKKADALVRRRAADADDVARTVDALKENLYLSARVEDEVRARGEQNRSQLDEIRRQQDDLRRRLESLLAH